MDLIIISSSAPCLFQINTSTNINTLTKKKKKKLNTTTSTRRRNYYCIFSNPPPTTTTAATSLWQKTVTAESGGGYLLNGGFSMALLSHVTTTAKVGFSPFVATLAANPTFVAGFFAWLMAQSLKVVLHFLFEKKLDIRMMCSSGGMPSSHSCLCTALTTSVALCHGVADSLFPVCLGFTLIVMYDAIGVRRHAGMQAQVLNLMVEDLFQGHPISKRKLKELLGHTPSQVIAGALLGIIIACFCSHACFISS